MVNRIPEAQQEAALDVLRRERIKLISLTPYAVRSKSTTSRNCAEPRRDRSGREEADRKGAGA